MFHLLRVVLVVLVVFRCLSDVSLCFRVNDDGSSALHLHRLHRHGSVLRVTLSSFWSIQTDNLSKYSSTKILKMRESFVWDSIQHVLTVSSLQVSPVERDCCIDRVHGDHSIHVWVSSKLLCWSAGEVFYLNNRSNISDLSVSFSPDEVGAAGRVEEGEDGGASDIRLVSLHFFDWQRRKNNNRFFFFFLLILFFRISHQETSEKRLQNVSSVVKCENWRRDRKNQSAGTQWKYLTFHQHVCM